MCATILIGIVNRHCRIKYANNETEFLQRSWHDDPRGPVSTDCVFDNSINTPPALQREYANTAKPTSQQFTGFLSHTEIPYSCAAQAEYAEMQY